MSFPLGKNPSRTPAEPPEADSGERETSSEKSVPPTPLNGTVRKQILRRFESWLDDILRSEEIPQGVAAELLTELQDDRLSTPDEAEENEDGDFYSLWSALTALIQETKLQGRAFKQLSENISPLEKLAPAVDSMRSAQEESQTAARQIIDDIRAWRDQQNHKEIQNAKQQGQEQFLNLLLDLRDRLVRGLTLARHHANQTTLPKRRWWRRKGGQIPTENRQMLETIEAMVRGYELTLHRLEEALKQLGVREISARGQIFDPQCMIAVDVEDTARTPEGTVLDVYRTGYQWEERIFRTAEVKVARRPKNSPESQNQT